MDQVIAEEVSKAVQQVLTTLTTTQIEPGAISKKSNHAVGGEILGIIGLAGANTNGTLVLAFEQRTLFQMLENMLGEKFDCINDDVLDATGEFTNLVCGDLKRRLAEHGYEIAMATPMVVHGKDIHIRDRVTRATYSIPFHTPGGDFFVETNISRRD